MEIAEVGLYNRDTVSNGAEKSMKQFLLNHAVTQ
jgi:hypothetical protein